MTAPMRQLAPHSPKVVAREGSFFNPRVPAPSGGRAILQIRIFDAINGAMAQALPERAMMIDFGIPQVCKWQAF